MLLILRDTYLDKRPSAIDLIIRTRKDGAGVLMLPPRETINPARALRTRLTCWSRSPGIHLSWSLRAGV